MGAAVLPLTAAAAGLSAFGAYRQAQAQKQAARYESQVAGVNAQIGDAQAADARYRGEMDAGQSDVRTGLLAGTQRAAFAASGVDATYGSAAGILADTSELGALDAFTIRQNATREAYAARVGAFGDRSQAAQSRAAADNISPGFSAATSLLTDSATFADRWSRKK